VERIGRGGMATVYKAYQPALERYVAIKVIHGQLAADDEQFLKRFQREAKAVATLRHPNIVQVFDFGIEDDVAYMVMEYLEGTTLKAALNALAERGEVMPLEEAQRVFLAVASALDHAHRQGMVHRDIKPANVMLTAKEDVVLTDFGIAKIVGGTQYTLTGAIIGTPAYMSPEQGQGERGDERSDVYALGVMLYEMVTGRVPFDADTPLAVILKHISAPLPLPRQVNPAIPEAVEGVVLRAMAKEPGDRYQSMVGMASALEAAMGGEAVPVRKKPLELPVAAPAARRRRAVPWTAIALGLVGVGLLALAAAVVVIGGGNLLAPRPTPVPTVTPTSAVSAVSPTASGTAAVTPTPTPTHTPVLPTLTHTLLPPTPTDTPVPPAPTHTPVPPTPTDTRVPQTRCYPRRPPHQCPRLPLRFPGFLGWQDGSYSLQTVTALISSTPCLCPTVGSRA
jgi:predicted Ser/Thr protein kinase